MALEHSIALAKAGSGTAVDFTGPWKNELHSTAHLIQTGDLLAGTYDSHVSSTGGSTIGDLVGHVEGDLISFVVHWRDFQAITAWVGQLRPDSTVDTLDTLWQMTRQVDAGGEWASIVAGADTFRRAS